MGVHYASRWKFMRGVRIASTQVICMVMSIPPVLRHKVRCQQTLTMMPASTEDIIILLALCRPFVLAQAIPLSMLMLLEQRRHFGYRHYTIACRLKEKTH